jgi:anti-sigma B factor antagonist
VDFQNLDYISSAGLGVLLATQQRLKKGGKAIKLVHMNRMVRDVFKIARFDLIFEIE